MNLNHQITREKFFDTEEREMLMKVTEDHSNADYANGRPTCLAGLKNTNANNFFFKSAKCKITRLLPGILTVLFSLPIMSSCSSETQQLLQEINNPVATEVAENFDNPPVEYSLGFYWGLGANVTGEIIASHLDNFKSKNVYNLTMEVGNPTNKYLSKEWFKKVDTIVRLAKEKNIRLYLVDEGGYPSGFAGGKFTNEAPELRMKALIMADTIKNVKGGETISRELSPDIISAAAFNKADTITLTLIINDSKLNWTAPEGEWQILLVKSDFRTSPTRSVNNPTRTKDATHSLCDYLDPEATRKYIEFVHEEYKKSIGDEFGKTVLGFRGDEPDYAIRGIPWTTNLFSEFEKIKGYKVEPYVASFLTPAMNGELRRIRADYWDVMSYMFAKNYFKVIGDWCADNNLKYLVHLNHEEKMVALAQSEGDFFRNMKSVQIPGVDAIWHQIWPGDAIPVFPKYASSAAHLNGRQRSFTESFAAYTPKPEIDQAKWIIDQQLVRGINMVEVMVASTSTDGRFGMRGWTLDAKFPEVAKYVHRASYLLSQGVPASELAVYSPTTSIWLGDDEADKHVQKIMSELLDIQHDFDIVDEESIDSLMKLGNGSFINLSGQRYSTVIIPSVSAISKKALIRLKEFKKSGGQVIFLGHEPKLVVDKTFRDATGPADISWALKEPSGELTETVIQALPKPDFTLDQPCKSVKYTHRTLKDAELYFVFNESDQQQNNKVTLSGKGQVQIWDAMTGKIENISSTLTGANSVKIDLSLKPWSTQFIVVGVKAK